MAVMYRLLVFGDFEIASTKASALTKNDPLVLG
jgi:hypothetical protein